MYGFRDSAPDANDHPSRSVPCNDVVMNRLANEQSPYLLQHASNPVDWWPWGEEAMTEAKRRDVPILLSVGYASCHLCFY